MTKYGDLGMTGSQFKAWRESHRLTQTQIAERFKVTRTTIQNWEAAPGFIPPLASIAASVWDARMRQEDPLLGPVTLVYSDGPMFLDPYGPRRRPAMMQQEPYPSNAMALARVQELWSRNDFHNPFVIAKDGSPVWNAVELGRVIGGEDSGAPTLINLLRISARSIRDNSSNFVRNSARWLTHTETKERQNAIESQASALDEIANAGLDAAIDGRTQIEAAFKRLLDLGTRAPDALVFGIHHALEIFEQRQRPRIDGPNYVLDYKGYQISWLRTPVSTAMISVDVSAEIMSLFSKIDRRQFPIMAPSSEVGVQQAKAYIDSVA
jgi:DNA-binding XRE family transcriptional regulator